MRDNNSTFLSAEKFLISTISKYSIVLISILLATSCIMPFEPGSTGNNGTLVVEGDIVQNDTTRIFLSYSTSLGGDDATQYHTNASVWIENDQGGKYNSYLGASDRKVCFCVNTIGLDMNTKYKLCIQHNDGNYYESEYLQILDTPEIDSIGFDVSRENKTVDLYVNSHDPQNNTRYYKWKFNEDWEFIAGLMVDMVYDVINDRIEELPFERNLFYCWGKSKSKAILVTTTEHLNNDIVHKKRLTTIDVHSQKVSYLYSMELHQMAISKEAYMYWEILRKNSDELGGIFSPQPSERSGNIKCISNPREKVLGYISAYKYTKKRVFVKNFDIGLGSWTPHCEYIFVNRYHLEPGDPSFTELNRMGYYIIQYDELTHDSTWANGECASCVRSGGSKKKPDFWPTSDI